MLAAAGRFARTEQRDPMMGPTARPDVVEYASAAGGPAAYDVSVVTPFRDNPGFVRCCAQTPGHAAAVRHREKLVSQYAHRIPGARLVPVVVEAGGRWHPSVQRQVRGLARAYVERTSGLAPEAVGLVVTRWLARLSALVIRGNAEAVRGLLPRWELASAARPGVGRLPHMTPEGESAYELMVR